MLKAPLIIHELAKKIDMMMPIAILFCGSKYLGVSYVSITWKWTIKMPTIKYYVIISSSGLYLQKKFE